MKDYYKIMNVPYDASTEDIRKAYRYFAKKYHPDKNEGQAAAVFLDIQEAYHTLSDERLRHHFHLRSHYPLPGTQPSKPSLTPETILQQCRQLKTKIHDSNRHQINPVFIAGKLEALLSDKNIKLLLLDKRTHLLEEVIAQLLPIIKLLPYKLVVPQTGRLLRLATHSIPLQEQIIAFGNRKRQLRYWERYNLLIVLAATLLLCVLIVVLSD